jgi:hypothetical protein
MLGFGFHVINWLINSSRKTVKSTRPDSSKRKMYATRNASCTSTIHSYGPRAIRIITHVYMGISLTFLPKTVTLCEVRKKSDASLHTNTWFSFLCPCYCHFTESCSHFLVVVFTNKFKFSLTMQISYGCENCTDESGQLNVLISSSTIFELKAWLGDMH